MRKKLERKCVNFYQKGKVRLLSPYGVHAAAVGVDAVADALAAGGEVGVFNTKVSKCPDLAIPGGHTERRSCLLYTSPSPRDEESSRMPSSA